VNSLIIKILFALGLFAPVTLIGVSTVNPQQTNPKPKETVVSHPVGKPLVPTAETVNKNKVGNLIVSPEAKELIVYYEVGGQSYYKSRLQRPEVPPGASGITIGIGYDCGYNTSAQIAKDWGGVIPDAHVKRFQAMAGKKGPSARNALGSVRDIIVPWDAALKVYENKTMPRFAALTTSTYPGITKQYPHIQGVMLSTTFNRGNSLTGDRRRELLWSRDAIVKNNAKPLPGYQLQMRRLWPNIPGLLKRYAAHAGLMQRALDEKK
jgi:hypothetical protein